MPQGEGNCRDTEVKCKGPKLAEETLADVGVPLGLEQVHNHIPGDRGGQTWWMKTHSIRSRCSSLGPKTMRFRADLVCSSPDSEWMVSRYWRGVDRVP